MAWRVAGFVTMKKVMVLLAAYNGERFIYEQIASILSARDFLDVVVCVGLDPSTDATSTVLERFAADGVEVVANAKSSGGAKQNFTQLVDYALGHSSDYYAFSDQDDVWDAKKLEKSINMLSNMEAEHGENLPLLVFSDSRLVKENLELISSSFIQSARLDPRSAGDIFRLIIQNVGQGCTFVFNRALLEMAAPVHKDARMHDHWFMLVASAFGKVGFIPEPLVSYRQHSSNVLGGSRFGFYTASKRVFNNLKELRVSIERTQLQAAAFADRYQELLDLDTISVLYEFSNLSAKSWLYRKFFCFNHRLRMGDPIRTFGFYLFV